VLLAVHKKLNLDMLPVKSAAGLLIFFVPGICAVSNILASALMYSKSRKGIGLNFSAPKL
jgi:hypothetical protein